MNDTHLAYDTDEGSLDEKIVWASDLDGKINTGPVLSSATLTTGTHTLTALVEDSLGLTDTVTTTVVIMPTLADLPPVPDQLVAAPNQVRFTSYTVVTDTLLSISNLNVNREISWTATVTVPWLLLRTPTGSTGGSLMVARNPDTPLVDGTHQAQITLTSPGLPAVKLEIPVVADVVLESLYIPLVQR